MASNNLPSPGEPAVLHSATVLADLWRLGGLDPAALAHAVLSGAEPVLASSFAVGTAAQAAIAAAALAAAELRHQRGQARQAVAVDMREAALECSGWFSLNGRVPSAWDKFSGLYTCGPEGRGGWVRIHTNFRHHRAGVLRVLGCPGRNSQSAPISKPPCNRGPPKTSRRQRPRPAW